MASAPTIHAAAIGADAGAGAFARWHDIVRVAHLLHEQVMPRLPQRFDASAIEELECSVVDARYHRHLNQASWGKATFTAAYQCVVNGRDTVWFGARMFRDARSAHAHELWRANVVDLVHLPGSDALVWMLPSEPSLSGLPALLATHERAHGSTAIASIPSTLQQDARCSVVKYRPLQRCALTMTRGRSDSPHPVAFAKVYADRRGLDTFGHLNTLARTGHVRLGDVLIPTALDYDAAHNALWLAHFDGVALDDHIALTDDGVLIERLGRSLAALHRMPLRAAPAPTLPALIADATKKAAKIIAEHPRAAAPLLAAIEQATRALADLPTAASACIHGDLHLGQWLQHGDALMLADFDELAIGDATLDIANLGVDLALRGLPAPDVHAVLDRFIAAYRAAGGVPFDASRVKWHAVMHWINRAYRQFLQQRPDVDRALDRGMVLLEAATRALGVRGADGSSQS